MSQHIPSLAQLGLGKCRCVSCGECGGTGQVEVPTPGYPETELESCTGCGGNGISEMCAHCEELQDLADSVADLEEMP
jgi:hypothetical protein